MSRPRPRELFVVDFDPGYILYTPLARQAVAATGPVLQKLTDEPQDGIPEAVRSLLEASEAEVPARRTGDFLPTTAALFLTSDCNLRCLYCYANAGQEPHRMPLEIARTTIDFLVANAEKTEDAAIGLTFHGGGEPTLEWDNLVAALDYASQKAATAGLGVRTSIGTNGTLLTPDRLDSMVDRIDHYEISFDGLPDIHNAQRPFGDSEGSFEAVDRALRWLTEKERPFGIRCTVTDHSVLEMPQMAQFIADRYRPRSVHFEPMFSCHRGRCEEVGMPSTEAFVAGFRPAAQTLRDAGIGALASGCNLSILSSSYCGVSWPNFCVTPQGDVTACFEALEASHSLWDLFSYGSIDSTAEGFSFDSDRIERLRSLTVDQFDHCTDCFCKYHCAGDCAARRYSGPVSRDDSLTDRCELIREMSRGALAGMLKGENHPRIPEEI